jgi:hypothetical protein
VLDHGIVGWTPKLYPWNFILDNDKDGIMNDVDNCPYAISTNNYTGHLNNLFFSLRESKMIKKKKNGG